MENKIERAVASAILERKAASIVVDGRRYAVAPPTLGTIILVSELASRVPVVDVAAEDKEGSMYLGKVLAAGGAAGVLAEIAATLILGAKAIKTQAEARGEARGPFRRCLDRVLGREPQGVNDLAALTRLIEDNVAPAALADIVNTRLVDLQLGDFFGLTISLQGANRIKPTREMGPTAPGE